MDLITCPNCISAYVAVQDRCPNCDADHEGEGARLELDAETRTAVARHGGLFGGILDVDLDRHLLWCTRGVCLYSDEIGLAWHQGFGSSIDAVHVAEEVVRVSMGPREATLGLGDGEFVEPS